MEFRILGPLEVVAGDRLVAVGAGKERALLAVLLLHANEVVPSERLIDELWGEAAPATVAKMVQGYVSHLRRALRGGGAGNGADGLLVTRAGGYMLRLEPGQFDLDCFERLLRDGRGALEAGESERAAGMLREALGLWRGPPLVDFGYEPFAQAEIARLEELRLAALEERIEADLELGRHADLVAELEGLIAEHPLRERVRGQLMLALYRCDRQADALEVYRRGRRRLVDELGLEPSPALQQLEQAILTQSAELAAPATRSAPGEHRLPVAPNRTIARGPELAALGERLRTPSVRLITLTGPGGVGKTRLALEAARAVEGDFVDGAHFVSLGALQRPEDVPAEIVKTLGVIVLAGESPQRAVERFLGAKRLLLVVDNFEHLLAAAPLIGGLLGACPALSVLATSREPLALHAEERYPVAPLALPELATRQDPQALAGVDAVALFSERARAHDPEFELGDGNAAAVAEICRRVDGLPLAIELAAARCGLLSPGEIAERLETALGALGAGARDAPARHYTLGATIDWSHELLSDGEKRCFARFAVFAGGATVEAAETITGADLDTLDHLVAKSLLERRQHALAPTRLGMLETIRAYAGERLASAADAEAVRENHYRYSLALAQRYGTERALFGAGAREHLARLDAEIDNLHAALGWAVAQASAERALAMVAALGCYWVMRNRYSDAVDWVEQALNLPGADAHPAERVRALCTKSKCLWQMGRAAEQPAILAALEATARRLGDPVILSQALQQRVAHEMDAERLAVADAVADEALQWAAAAGDAWEIAEAFRGKATATSSITDLRERVDTAASLLTDVGNVHQLAGLLNDAAYSALCLGSERDAADFASRAAPIARALDSRFERMINSGNLGLAALLTGETDAASHAFREELSLCRDMVVRPVVFEGLRGLAAVAVLKGDATRAATLLGAAGTHRYDTPEYPVDARLDETFFEPARTRYGPDAWNAAAREGSALSFEEAIAYALEARPV
jgi:predicted ATPase/DNA-binding SARP family transcriptional activator